MQQPPTQLELFSADASGAATPRIAALQHSASPSTQGELPSITPPMSAAELEHAAADALRLAVEQCAGMPIHLRITNNRATVMSVRYENSGKLAQLRLHHMFLAASPEIIAALAHWVRHPRSRKHAALLNGFIRTNNHLIRPAPVRRAPVRTQGAVHDLQAMYDALNQAEFAGRVDAPITWGKMPSKLRRRSIRFGSYAPQEHLIRIHPLLDDAQVPEWFVQYIVFHEMLHADLGIEEIDGRRVIHSRAFRAREKQYVDFARAVAWMETPANLGRLLGRGRTRRSG